MLALIQVSLHEPELDSVELETEAIMDRANELADELAKHGDVKSAMVLEVR
jgi:hypothetical protein